MPRQPTFDYKAVGKYHELCKLKIEVSSIFMTKNLIHRKVRGSPVILN